MNDNLSTKLFSPKECGWKGIDENRKNAIFELAKRYMDFLNISKTEREFVKNARELANGKGFKDIMEYETLKPRDKVYFRN